MIVTLIKNGELLGKKSDLSAKLTHTAVSNLIHDTVMLLHFCGIRPLYSVSNTGEYELKIPEKTLPLPELILTEPVRASYDSGKAVREVFKAKKISDLAIKTTKKISYPRTFSEDIQHLIVIGDEITLNKWGNWSCKKESQKRTKDSPFCIIKDGTVFFDTQTNPIFYMQDGIMDSLLLRHIQKTPINELEKELLPYKNNIGQIMPAGFILYKLYKERNKE